MIRRLGMIRRQGLPGGMGDQEARVVMRQARSGGRGDQEAGVIRRQG